MRTYSEIQQRIRDSDSFFGFDVEVLVSYLPLEECREFLKPEVKEWEHTANTTDVIYEDLAEYMSFAWKKANDERGLSAVRSIEKIMAWLFLLERDDLIVQADSHDNEPYGKGILRFVCQQLELKIEG